MATLTDIDQELENRNKVLDRELAGRSLLGFTTYTFEKYNVNWHHELMCKEIDEWIDAEQPYNLLIQVPPRHGKSELCSRRLPGYIFGRYPDKEVLLASYSGDMATRMSRDAQKVMLTPEYKEVFPGTKLKTKGLKTDETAIRRGDEFTISDHKGSMKAAGVEGSFTGRGADIGIIDDPVKDRKDAESATKRESVIDWYTSTFRSRLEKGGRMLLLMTRWHTDDLAGWCIKKTQEDLDADQWKVISLPALYEEGEFSHPDDKRKPGEALWPWKYDEKALKKTKATSGTYDWCSLYRQIPLPPGGAIIKRDWIKVIDPVDVPEILFWVRYWDLAVSTKTKADYTASVRMGIDARCNIYISRLVHAKMEWPVTKKLLTTIALQEKISVGIETNATQVGFFQDLNSDLQLIDIPLFSFNESKDKLTRALPWVARAEAGKVYLVAGKGVDNYINELVVFTGKDDTHDDQVDATSGAYRMLSEYIDPELKELGDYA